MKIYIACSITNVPDDHYEKYWSYISDISKSIEEIGFESRYALRDSEPEINKYDDKIKPQICYQRDKNLVRESSLVIAEVSYPSLGIGIELQIAAENKIPIILCYRSHEAVLSGGRYFKLRNTKIEVSQSTSGISLMALGIPAVQRSIAYSSYSDGIDKITSMLKSFKL